MALKIGDLISIYANKKNIIQKSKDERVIEAIGNVVIIHGAETIYGDVAKFNEKTLDFSIEGNVRLITPEYNLFASRAEFGQKEGKLVLENSKMFAATYALVADRIERSSDDVYWAYMAEFSTCKDCPESWSIFGKSIRIERNEYVTIYDGMVKIKGSEFLYLPIFVFPIKRDRTSGFLFPQIFYRRNDGMTYAQPYFWAIAPDKDATLTPLIMLKRGEGMRWEYRQAFNNKSQLQVQGLSNYDQIYLPNKENYEVTGEKYARHYLDFEWGQTYNNHWRHYLSYNTMRDLDMVRDFPIYLQNNFQIPFMGAEGFLEKRGSIYSSSLSFTQKRTLLNSSEIIYQSMGESDKSTVNVLPRLNLSMMPVVWNNWNFPFFRRMNFSFNSDYTVFRQNQNNDDTQTFLRNAERVNLNPNLWTTLYDDGSFHLTTNLNSDFQSYHFSSNPRTESAQKYANILKTDFNFSVEKIFGLSYVDQVTKENMDDQQTNKKDINSSMISAMPEFSKETSEKKVPVLKNSYKHSHDLHFIHHYLLNDAEYGNQQFWRQVNASPTGRFDRVDAVRRREFQDLTENSRTLIPPTNTVEFQWNQLVIKKSAKLPNVEKDNSYLLNQFDYSNLISLNVSQGFDIDEYHRTNNSNDSLTRLATTISMSTSKYWGVSLSDYFFHQEKKHILNGNVDTNFSIFSLAQGINYSGFSLSKSYRFLLAVSPTDKITLKYGFEKDLGSSVTVSSNSSINYKPANRCWMIELGTFRSVQERRFTFDFVVNFGNATQSSIF